MQIVIDIPEEKYLYAKAMIDGGKEKNPVVIAIGNGTPLPKGHGRLIDADAYIDKNEVFGWLDDMIVDEFNAITPTIIEADKGE